MKKFILIAMMVLGIASLSGSKEERLKVQENGGKEIINSLDGFKNSLDSINIKLNEKS